MIRFKLTQRIADHSQKVGRKLTLDDVAKEADVHRTTLSRMNKIKGCNATTHNLDRLCIYFGCELSDLAEFVPSAPPPPRKRAGKAKKEDAAQGLENTAVEPRA